MNSQRERGNEAILLVDDEIELLRVSSRLIRTLGYTVHTARGGQEALDFLGSDHADLVVLDMVMPQLDGVETLRRIRQLKPDQKVVILSAFAEPERVAQVKALGVYAYLQKPFSLDSMAQTLRNVLDGIADETF